MPIALADLSPDVRKYLKDGAELAADAKVPSEEVLAAIGIALGKLRDEAKDARKASGIEARWAACEEAYAGIDDANRGEVGSHWTKGMTPNAPITADDLPQDETRSTLYPLLTQRYVDAAAAKIAEILLAPGAKSFSIKATPVPEAINAKDDERPVLLDHLPGSPPAMRAPKPGELLNSTAIPPSAIAAPAAPVSGAQPVPAPAEGAVSPAAGAAGPPGMVPVKVGDLAKEKIARLDEAAKKAEERIYDWHVECRRSSQVRKQLHDAARLGVGVLKGPYSRPTRQMATRKAADGTVELGIRHTVMPASKWVNAWNFFPDPGCGEDIHDGDHCFEREWASQRQVRKLKSSPGYIQSQIDKVLIEGPQKVNLKDGVAPSEEEAVLAKKGKFEIWYFNGTLSREEMGCVCEMAGPKEAEKWAAHRETLPPDKQQVDVIATMINDCVVKAAINPLDSGDFNYHPMPWERRTGSWAGRGVAEQVAVPQKILTASIRSMMDNAGISAGGQIVIDTSVITPADGEMAMSPHKIWYLNGEGERLNVNEAFGLFRVDNVTDQMLKLVELAMRQAEESTSIPLVTQGQSGKTTPDTYGGMALQDNNANQLLRSIGYTYDDFVTEPETRQYYERLILDPDVPAEEKGDWTIDAHGSTALVERAIQDQTIAQLLPLSIQSPAFGLNPKRTMEVYLRSKKLTPADLQNTEEEQAAIDAQPPPAAPQIEAANIRATVERERIAAAAADAKADNDRADREVLTDATVRLKTLELEERMLMLRYATQQQVSLDRAKTDLAKVTMTLTAQERMNQRDGQRDMTKHRESQPPRKQPRPQPQRRNGNGGAPQIARPVAEPAGRATPGTAFQA